MNVIEQFVFMRYKNIYVIGLICLLFLSCVSFGKNNPANDTILTATGVKTLWQVFYRPATKP
jgi:hypothetical protein